MEVSKKKTNGHLDVQYSPSRWSTRMCSCKVMNEHFDFIKQESKRARQIPSQIDISYGKSESEKIDIIGTDLPDDAAICLYIHGGFWQALSKTESAFPGLALHKIGIKVFAIDYALCPHVSLKRITEQILSAFKFAVTYARKHKSKYIHLMGHSAGAHLVAYLLGQLYEEPKNKNSTSDDKEIIKLAQKLVKHAILISGIYDLRPLINVYVNDALNLTLSEATKLSPLLWFSVSEEDNEEIRETKNQMKISLLLLVNLNVHVIVAENDSPVFHGESKQIYEKLKDIGLRVEYMEVLDKDHFDLVHCIVHEGEVNNHIVQIFLKD